MQNVPVLNIIGPVGIGKSSVAEAISEILTNHLIPHAIVDLDDVRRAYPEPSDDPFHMMLGFRNLAAVWANYQAVGARCLIIPSVMEQQSHFDEIRQAVPGTDLFVVRLEAPLEVNHARIRGREKTPESLKWHLNRSTQLREELRQKQLEDVVIETESKTPRDIATEIIALWGVLEKIQPTNTR